MEVKKYVHKLSDYMDKVAMAEMYNKQAAKDKPGAYISHYAELRTDEQPRARSTAPSAQSLPLTTRPAGSGALCRAGLFARLASLSTILCLIPFSLCHYYEASEAKNTKKDLSLNTFLPQQNVTEPLITSAASIVQKNGRTSVIRHFS